MTRACAANLAMDQADVAGPRHDIDWDPPRLW
jgi:hypothetical protein